MNEIFQVILKTPIPDFTFPNHFFWKETHSHEIHLQNIIATFNDDPLHSSSISELLLLKYQDFLVQGNINILEATAGESTYAMAA